MVEKNCDRIEDIDLQKKADIAGFLLCYGVISPAKSLIHKMAN